MSRRLCKLLNESVISSGFLDTFDYVLTDCDGVLWMKNDALPGSVETIQALKELKKHVIYLTNNNSKTNADCLKKCKSLKFPATESNVISSSYCAVSYLKSLNFQKKVYVIGSPAITKELDIAKISYLPVGPDNVPENWESFAFEHKLEPGVGAVLVGFDPYISFVKLIKAASYLKKPDTLFIATNRDEYFPMNEEITVPATGTFVKAVEVASGRKAITIGKPEKFMLECVKKIHPNVNLDRCIMIGDTLKTDILFGTKHGLRTVFVLTGVNTLEDVRKLEKSDDPNDQLLVPDFYLNSLGDLLPFIRK